MVSVVSSGTSVPEILQHSLSLCNGIIKYLSSCNVTHAMVNFM